MRLILASTAIAVLAIASPAQAVDTTASTDAGAMADAIEGPGVTFTSAVLTGDGPEVGFFSNGAAATGIASGIVLTTGGLNCVGSSNTLPNCTGASGTFSQLQLGFTATSSDLFFNYVFGSEEYNEFVNSSFNDTFSLVLNGMGFSNVNLATLPGGGGEVSINNVNNGSNSAFYRDNTVLGLPIEYDGLTTLLTAQALGLTVGQDYTLTFHITDVGDSFLDSGVFIQGGSVGVVTPPNPIPEPATWAMLIGGFGLVGAAMRRRPRIVHAIA